MPDLLKLATAGSVDDGKSTLVGRLLYDTKSVLADQMEAVERATQGGGDPDLSLLVDGLRSEREQGITIDVAYRYFATPNRSFVLADTPGHVQYTRNTVTGASTAALAVLLVDARAGIVEQTRRHVAVMGLLRVPRLVLAVNKMDLVDHDENTYWRIAKEFVGLTDAFGYADDAVTAIPLSAKKGDNVVLRLGEHALVRGPDAARAPRVGAGRRRRPLRAAPLARSSTSCARAPSRIPTTAATPASSSAGTVRVGDEVWSCPTGSGPASRASTPSTASSTPPTTGRASILRLADDLGIARGAVIAAPGAHRSRSPSSTPRSRGCTRSR